MSPAKSLHVAVFLPTPSTSNFGAQLLDTACVDVLALHSKSFLAPLAFIIPPELDLIALAPEIKISYVGVQPAKSQMELTAQMKIQLTHHFKDEEVQPGKVDVVLVPGPDPREPWDPEALAWLKAHLDTAGTDILSICTGIFVCGAAGLLQDKKACGPRNMQGMLAEHFAAQNVEWVGEDLRWTRDGNFWSCGGVTNGNDLVAHYARESGRFAPELTEFALAMADVGDRPQRYGPRSEQATRWATR